MWHRSGFQTDSSRLDTDAMRTAALDSLRGLGMTSEVRARAGDVEARSRHSLRAGGAMREMEAAAARLTWEEAERE